MDIKQLAADLNQNLPYGVTVRAVIPNNYLGIADEANAYLLVKVEDVRCLKTNTWRTRKQQWAQLLETRDAIMSRVPARATKGIETGFGGNGHAWHRDGFALQLHPRLMVALKAA